eukprot:gene17440-biopygen9393
MRSYGILSKSVKVPAEGMLSSTQGRGRRRRRWRSAADGHGAVPVGGGHRPRVDDRRLRTYLVPAPVLPALSWPLLVRRRRAGAPPAHLPQIGGDATQRRPALDLPRGVARHHPAVPHRGAGPRGDDHLGPLLPGPVREKSPRNDASG